MQTQPTNDTATPAIPAPATMLQHLVTADLARYEHQLAAAPVRHEAALADARKLGYKAEVLRQATTTHYELYHH